MSEEFTPDPILAAVEADEGFAIIDNLGGIEPESEEWARDLRRAAYQLNLAARAVLGPYSFDKEPPT